MYDSALCFPAAEVQSAIGAKHAAAFEIRNACNSFNFSLNNARCFIESDDEITRLLQHWKVTVIWAVLI